MDSLPEKRKHGPASCNDTQSSSGTQQSSIGSSRYNTPTGSLVTQAGSSTAAPSIVAPAPRRLKMPPPALPSRRSTGEPFLMECVFTVPFVHVPHIDFETSVYNAQGDAIEPHLRVNFDVANENDDYLRTRSRGARRLLVRIMCGVPFWTQQQREDIEICLQLLVPLMEDFVFGISVVLSSDDSPDDDLSAHESARTAVMGWFVRMAVTRYMSGTSWLPAGSTAVVRPDVNDTWRQDAERKEFMLISFSRL